MRKLVLFGSLVAIAAWGGVVQAENWANWRGPLYTGVSDASNLPTSWSEEENIRWKVDLPGRSAATPIVWEDRVFTTALDEETNELIAICVDRSNGEVLWREVLGITGWVRQGNNSPASPSPVTDGELVYFLFGTGDLAALDFDGNVVWARALQEEFGRFEVQFGYGASPLLYDGILYFLLLQRDYPVRGPRTREGIESFLLAIDPKTGEDLWRHVRESDARDETLEAYTTPIPHTHNGRTEILVFGADYATGHDPKTGEELWRWGNYNPRKIGHWRIVPTPVADSNHVYVAAPKREPLFAIQLGGEGNLDDDAISWTFTDNPPDVCTPVYHDGTLYVLDGDRHFLTSLNAETGEKISELRLDSRTVTRTSPTLADGKFYFMNEDGLVFVVGVGSELSLLNTIQMESDNPAQSTISAVGDELFIRTGEALYCIAYTE